MIVGTADRESVQTKGSFVAVALSVVAEEAEARYDCLLILRCPRAGPELSSQGRVTVGDEERPPRLASLVVPL